MTEKATHVLLIYYGGHTGISRDASRSLSFAPGPVLTVKSETAEILSQRWGIILCRSHGTLSKWLRVTYDRNRLVHGKHVVMGTKFVGYFYTSSLQRPKDVSRRSGRGHLVSSPHDRVHGFAGSAEARTNPICLMLHMLLPCRQMRTREPSMFTVMCDWRIGSSSPCLNTLPFLCAMPGIGGVL